MKKIIVFILTLLISVSLTACKPQLSEYMIIEGMGIDKNFDSYTVSIRFASLDNLNPESLITVTADSVTEAIGNISLESGQKPLFSSTSYIVIGKSLAEEGLDIGLDFFVRYFEIKPTVSLFVASDKAEDILSAKKDDKLIPSKLITGSVDNEESEAETVKSTVLNFISDNMSESNSALVPIIELSDEKYSSRDAAVFADYKMIDSLDYEETQGYLAFSGKLKHTIISLDTDISFDIREISADLSHNIHSDSVGFNLKVDVKASPLAYPLSEKIQDFSAYKDLISQEIKRLLEKCFEKAKKADFLGLENNLYLSDSEYLKYHEFDVAEVEIKTTVNTELVLTPEEK